MLAPPDLYPGGGRRETRSNSSVSDTGLAFAANQIQQVQNHRRLSTMSFSTQPPAQVPRVTRLLP